MKQQQTFADVEYSGRKRTTKREKFLEMMEENIPWAEWFEALVKPIP